MALAFLAALPIERFHGIGPATARRMQALGIVSGADLQARGEHELVQAFGQAGRHYCGMAQARDDRSVEPDRARRSLSVETTFGHDLQGLEALEAALAPLADELAARLERSGFFGRTLTLKLRYGDWVYSRHAARHRSTAGESCRWRASCSGSGHAPMTRSGSWGWASRTPPKMIGASCFCRSRECAALGAELDGVRLLLAGLG